MVKVDIVDIVDMFEKVGFVGWFASKVLLDDVVCGAVGGWRGGVEL